MKELRNLFSWIIDKSLAKNGNDISGKSLTLTELRPYLLKLNRPIERNLHIRALSLGLDVPEAWILEELGISPAPSRAPKMPSRGETHPSHSASSSEEVLLELFIKFEDLQRAIIDKLSSNEFLNDVSRELAEFLWEQVGLNPSPLTEIMNRITNPQSQALFRKLALKDNDWDPTLAQTVALDCIERIKHKTLKMKLGSLSLQIREAEAQQQTEKVTHLLKEKQSLLTGHAGSK